MCDSEWCECVTVSGMTLLCDSEWCDCEQCYCECDGEWCGYVCDSESCVTVSGVSV